MTFYRLSSGRLACSMIFLIVLLSACVQQTPVRVPEHPQLKVVVPDASDKAWYAVRFSLPWEKGQEPAWYLGTLLAGEVLVPLLGQYGQQITCWRIHRRAVQDKTGHVFSFIFFSSETSAIRIYQHLKNDKLLAQLQQQRLLLKVSYDPFVGKSGATLAETSDPGWPESIRETWPYFMMGVSQMWLAQVQALKLDTQDDQDIEPYYQAIQRKITELWQQQGQHAMIHHLNALYAYQPVLMRF